VALLAASVFLGITATPTLGQSSDELAEMRKEIEALKEGQKALQRDLQDIKALLRPRLAPDAGGPHQPLAQPVVLRIDGAPSVGSGDAKVTLVEFTDFQCPFCARHSQQTLPRIVKEYVDTGKVRYVLRDFPIQALHPGAHKAHEAAHCAGEQGKYWAMHDRLFDNLRSQQASDLKAHAKALRLDVDAFDQCLASDRHAARVRDALQEGQRASVRGTPTFFVGVDGDGRTVKATRMLRGAQAYEQFKAVIDALLSEAR
jgi:protein-disulfide isomerase